MFFCLIVFPWLPTDKYNAFIRIFVFIGDIEFFFFFFLAQSDTIDKVLYRWV